MPSPAVEAIDNVIMNWEAVLAGVSGEPEAERFVNDRIATARECKLAVLAAEARQPQGTQAVAETAVLPSGREAPDV